MQTIAAMTEHPLKLWRRQSGFSQDAAAAHLGVSRWTVNQIEVGKYRPHWKLCKRLSESTGIDLHVFNSEIFPSPAVAAASQESAPSEVPHG